MTVRPVSGCSIKRIEPKEIVFDYDHFKVSLRRLAKWLNESGVFYVVKLKYTGKDEEGREVERREQYVMYRRMPYSWFDDEDIYGATFDEEGRLIIYAEIPEGIFPCNTAKPAMTLIKAANRRLNEISRRFRELKGKREALKELNELSDEAHDIMIFAFHVMLMALTKRGTKIPDFLEDLAGFAKELGVSIEDIVNTAYRSVEFSCNRDYADVARLALRVMNRADRLNKRLLDEVFRIEDEIKREKYGY